MTLGERLKEIRKDLNKDLKTFSDDLGISYQSLANYENSHRGISDEVKQLLVKEYNINLNWLLTGEGSMYVGGKSKSVVVKADQINLEIVDDEDELIEIPLLDIKASAGYGVDGEDHPDKKNMLTLRKALLGKYAKYKVQAIEVTGNSMEPDFKDGDVVLCAIGVVESSGFYIINIKGQILLKILQFFDDKIKIKILKKFFNAVIRFVSMFY